MYNPEQVIFMSIDSRCSTSIRQQQCKIQKSWNLKLPLFFMAPTSPQDMSITYSFYSFGFSSGWGPGLTNFKYHTK